MITPNLVRPRAHLIGRIRKNGHGKFRIMKSFLAGHVDGGRDTTESMIVLRQRGVWEGRRCGREGGESGT